MMIHQHFLSLSLILKTRLSITPKNVFTHNLNPFKHYLPHALPFITLRPPKTRKMRVDSCISGIRRFWRKGGQNPIHLSLPLLLFPFVRRRPAECFKKID